MSKQKIIGDRGEALATTWLEGNDYAILEKNWRYGRAEVDIICKLGGIVVFVEVKCKESNEFGYPEGMVTTKKQRLLMEAASRYLFEIGHEGEFRFDVISVTLQPEIDIVHFADAFFPGSF